LKVAVRGRGSIQKYSRWWGDLDSVGEGARGLRGLRKRTHRRFSSLIDDARTYALAYLCIPGGEEYFCSR